MKTLLEVVDELNITRDFVECAFMAANEVPSEWAEPIRAVLNVASNRIKATVDAVDRMRAAERGR